MPQTIEGAFAQGATRDDRRAARLEDRAQRLDVLELGRRRAISSSTSRTMSWPTSTAHYRTMADRKSRGLVGHSMGGYGATRIGMKHADVFGSLYIMSPCCLSARDSARRRRTDLEKALAGHESPADLAALPFFPGRSSRRPPRGRPTRRTRRSISTCPRRTACRGRRFWRTGRPTRRWPSWISTSGTCASTAPSRSTSAIRTGSRPTPAAARRARSLRHRNTFEIYSGTHTSKVADRFQNHVMPFFHRTLCHDTACE